MKKKEDEIIRFEQTQTRVGLEETNAAAPTRTDDLAKVFVCRLGTAHDAASIRSDKDCQFLDSAQCSWR